jgi:uncharacterized OB-fold protein
MFYARTQDYKEAIGRLAVYSIMLKKCKKCGKDFVTEKDHLFCHNCWMSEIEKAGGMTDDA